MRSIKVENWKDLLRRVDELDKNKFTFILSGYINRVGKKKNKIYKLIFTTCKNDVLSSILDEQEKD